MDNDKKDENPISTSKDALIKSIALVNIKADPKSLADYTIWLKRWWCRRYNRPYKDPLLETYTFEELLLEYYEMIFLDKPETMAQAESEIRTGLYEDDDEEWLREVMGANYQTQEEMASSNLKDDPDE